MVTKEQLLKASAFSGISKSYKGVFTTEKAKEYLESNLARIGRSSLTIISSMKTNSFFFSDDHCFGIDIAEMKEKGFVPCTAQIPLHVKERESLPSGVVRTIEEYITIFHRDEKQINSIEELVELLNS